MMTSTDIKKPEKSHWTDEQWQAIIETGRDILIAAAAGSGKTAVLVERIIQKITNSHHPIDVDRLLVVTFTNAAAAEMRARIAQAIENALASQPESEYLRRQMLLLNRASIMTFHSFCMSVVKRYYYLLELDPSFRTAEETEAELLREEVMEELLETYYSEEDNHDFYRLVDSYSNDKNDLYLQSLILKLYDFSRSHPYPDQWLDDMKNTYRISPNTTADDLLWTKDIKETIQNQLQGLLPLLNQAEDLCLEASGPEPYVENIKDDRELIEQLIDLSLGDWDRLNLAFNQLNFTKLKRVGKEVDDVLKEQVKAIRETIKKQMNKLKDELFSRTPEEQLDDIKAMAPHISLLVELVKGFTERYQSIKREKSIVDFSDLEHYCLEILSVSVNDQDSPSNIALKYREQFNEILVDEYQDTNLVQETILQFISKDQATEAGNLFMVGDVKQSIYRFRLAEPSLFLTKYKQFNDHSEQGTKIDLANNFRSRPEVIDGTNFIFKQVMDQIVGEINYDDDAELKFGASYYATHSSKSELYVIDRHAQDSEEVDESSDMQTAMLEAVQIAKRIKSLIGANNEEVSLVYDKDLKRNRPIQYRDIVILMRAVQGSAPMMLDVFRQYGIPVHVELTSGYFEATEVAIMLSLLKVIDNPYQDIPIASVLRSPLVGLTGEDLAQIRLADNDSSYYEAVKSYIKTNHDSLATKCSSFLEQITKWRDLSRKGALADLIWDIYRDTGYYDYVAGTVGGTQRQANLKALYDRAHQYESTSFRGLFRFLRFIERMQDRGNDLGEARALGEQEDVVRIMTIHKSKGLEYPVVFVAGLNKKFNRQDIYRKTLLHKSLGFATKFVDPDQRIIYPTIPFSAVKQKLESELLAEEMRVLYVALTRAREKLILIATTRDIQKTCEKWLTATQSFHWLLQDQSRNQANSYFDWVGPALFRHRDAEVFHKLVSFEMGPSYVCNHPSRWDINIIPSEELLFQPNAIDIGKEQAIDKLKHWQQMETEGLFGEQVKRQLTWQYPFESASKYMTKQTVTEIKRQQERFNDGFDTVYIRQFQHPIGDRPKFLQDESLSANERGTAMHMFMQLVDLRKAMTYETIQEACQEFVANELLTEQQVEAIDIRNILDFFNTDVGKKMLGGDYVTRELPFTLMLPVNEAYADYHEVSPDKVMVQGVIDCIIDDGEVVTLLDYKTDAIHLRFESIEDAKRKMAEKYRTQLNIYKKAIEQIWGQPVNELLLYFFDGGFFIKL